MHRFLPNISDVEITTSDLNFGRDIRVEVSIVLWDYNTHKLVRLAYLDRINKHTLMTMPQGEYHRMIYTRFVMGFILSVFTHIFGMTEEDIERERHLLRSAIASNPSISFNMPPLTGPSAPVLMYEGTDLLPLLNRFRGVLDAMQTPVNGLKPIRESGLINEFTFCPPDQKQKASLRASIGLPPEEEIPKITLENYEEFLHAAERELPEEE